MSGQADFERAKARYNGAKGAARLQASINLKDAWGIEYYLSNLSVRALEELAKQWPMDARKSGGGGWNWEEIRKAYCRDLGTLDMAIWLPDHRLAGLGLCRSTGTFVMVEFVEGDPRPDCPLGGKRLLIVLEAATCYAQKLDRREIRAVPTSHAVRERLVTDLGFSLETPRKGEPYCRREV